MGVAHLGKILQYSSAALGIPAAVAGTYSAYQTYFSSAAICQQLRASIVSTMEQNVSAAARRALLRKDVDEFDTRCGGNDPDARSLFQAELKNETPASAAAPGPVLAYAGSDAVAGLPSSIANVFGHSPNGELRGWVALVRAGSDGVSHVNFDGFALSLTSLPPAGAVLRARDTLPVWRQPQRGPNNQNQFQGRVAAGRCVRVLATQPAEGSERAWGEVVPIACPATPPTAAN
jgi:hypothetical protein